MYAGFAATISKTVIGVPYVCSIHNELRTVLPIRTCNKALAVSGYIKNSLIGPGRFTENKVDILNVAVDIDACKSTKTVKEAKKELGLEDYRILLFVGRKCYEKGPHVLINALPKILLQNQNVLAVFVGPDYFFGVNISEYTQALISLAEKRNVKDNVVFKGHVSNDVKLLYYNAAEVFVCPSIWQDPSPTVVKEALSFGKPVVATNVGGTSEIITHGYNGLIVAPNNAEALADAVNLLLNDREYAEKLGSNGRKVVEKKFNFETVTEDCLKIYHQLV